MKIVLFCLVIAMSFLKAAPIHNAAESGEIGKVRVFLNDGENIDIQNRKYKQTPLHLAVYNEHKDIAKLLIERGADVDATMINGQTPLFLAAYYGDIDTVRLLIKNGAKVDIIDKKKNTPLHKAAEGGSADVAQFLISKGAKVNVQNSDGDTPLHVSAFMGNEEVVWVLVKNGIDASLENEEGITAADEAEEEDYGRIVKIIEKHAN